jgi:glutamine synthetase
MTETLPLRTLERAIPKPRKKWCVDDFIELVRTNGVRLISLMHIGGDGWLKTLDFVPKSLDHLRDILEGGERADGSSLFAGLGIPAGASDILLRPRLDRAFLDPFAEQPTLVLICGHDGRDGKPLAQSPDTILRRAYERMKTVLGVDLWALGEIEYFLGKRANENDMYGADERGYHATSPFVFGENLRRRALVTLAEMGVPVKYGHSEVGYIASNGSDNTIWEQHEVELLLAPLPEAAEGVVLTQWVLRNLAHRDGMRCSFDPILRQGHAGSGLHFHLSPLIDHQDRGRDLKAGGLLPPGQWLVAGLLQYGASLMAFGNRSSGSFIRLNQKKESPETVSWGMYDRKALIRLPVLATAPDGRLISAPTIEFRLPDGSAHPYLLLAGIAQAMVAGRSTQDLESLLDKTEASRIHLHPEVATVLPKSFTDIASSLRDNRKVLEEGDVFPPGLIDSMLMNLR